MPLASLIVVVGLPGVCWWFGLGDGFGDVWNFGCG